MGGCQNYGAFWVPIIIRHLIFWVPKKGTIILTTTHILMSVSPQAFYISTLLYAKVCGFSAGAAVLARIKESEPHSTGKMSGCSTRFYCKNTAIAWVAVKELKLSYHNGYIYIVNNRVSNLN